MSDPGAQGPILREFRGVAPRIDATDLAPSAREALCEFASFVVDREF